MQTTQNWRGRQGLEANILVTHPLCGLSFVGSFSIAAVQQQPQNNFFHSRPPADEKILKCVILGYIPYPCDLGIRTIYRNIDEP